MDCRPALGQVACIAKALVLSVMAILRQVPDFRSKTVYSLLEMAPKRVLILAIVSFVIYTPIVSPQTASVSSNDDLYSVALRASILQMEKEWGHLGHNALEEGIPTDYRHMIVRKDPNLTDGLPTAFEDHSVEYLDDHELIDRYRRLKNSFAVLEIVPIRNQGTALKVVVSTSWFTFKKNHLMFGRSDWSDVEFRYDCEQGAFIISSIKLGGI
jgi:hypothetical protein